MADHLSLMHHAQKAKHWSACSGYATRPHVVHTPVLWPSKNMFSRVFLRQKQAVTAQGKLIRVAGQKVAQRPPFMLVYHEKI